MLKRLLKDSATYGIGRLAGVALAFATLPILTNHLTVAQYGMVDLLVLCITLLNLTVALEVTQGVARFAGSEKNHDKRSVFTSTALLFSTIMYIIAGLIIFIFHKDISYILFGEKGNPIFILLMIPWFILHGVNYFVTNQMRWESRAVPYILLRTLHGVLMLAAVIWLVSEREMKVQGVIFAYIISLAIPTAIGIGMLISFKSLRRNFCKIRLKEMLAFSFPLVPSSAAVFAQSYVDRIMVTNMLDLQNLGLYSFAFRIASAITLVSMAFQMSITPLIYQLHKKKKTPKNIAKSFNIYLFFVFTAIIGLYLFLAEIFYFFIGEAFYESAKLVPILCFSVFFASLSVFAPGLSIAKKTKKIAIINVTGMFINVILNFVFIKYFGLMGAAVATVISLAIVMVITFAVSNKYYAIPYRYFRIVIGSLMCVGTLYAISQYQNIGDFSFTKLAIKIFIYGAIAALLWLVLNYKFKKSRRTS